MGKPIIYCNHCRQMILPQDIAEGKAFTGGGKFYCYNCAEVIKQTLGQAPAHPDPVGTGGNVRPNGNAPRPAVAKPTPSAPVLNQPRTPVVPGPAQPVRPSALNRPGSAPIRPVSPIGKPPVRPAGASPLSPAPRQEAVPPPEDVAAPPENTPEEATQPMPPRRAFDSGSGRGVPPHQMSGVTAHRPTRPLGAAGVDSPGRPGASRYQIRRPGMVHSPADDSGEEEIVTRRSSSQKYFIISGAVGLVLIVVILIIVLTPNKSDKTRSGNKTGDNTASSDNQKATQEERLTKAKQAFDDFSDYESKHPLESKEILRRITAAKEIVVDTPYESQLKEKSEEHSVKVNALQEINDFRKSFEQVPGNFDYYLTEYDKLKKRVKTIRNNEPLMQYLDELIKKVNDTRTAETEQQKEDKLKELKKEVADLITKNSFADARLSCDNFPEELKKLPGVEAELAKLKTDIARAETTYQERKKNEVQSLLNPEDISNWKFIGNCKYEVKDGVLSVENLSDAQNIVVVGETAWTNYQVEIEYKIAQGAATIWLHLDYEIKDNSLNTKKFPLVIPLQPKFGSKDWQKITVELKDDIMVIKKTGESDEQKSIKDPRAATNGAIGFLLKPSDKILIKSVKVKGVME